MTDAEAEAFVRGNTAPSSPPLVSEFTLHLADEITPIWQATEDFLHTRGMAPPFWAFAWPGSQVLARAVLDGIVPVAGRRVLDFAAGCGLAALAACRAGAASAAAADIDPLALAAVRVNAAANGVHVETLPDEVVGSRCRWHLILCGDVCYEAPMTDRVLPWLRAMATEGADVLVADPGRAYLPRAGLVEIMRRDVPTTMELESTLVRETVLWRLEGAGS